MKVTLLGTGSPDPSVTRASSGYLVQIKDELLLFDHGAGAHTNFLRTGHNATDVNTLFLSHLHSDHILDYARLVHSRWDQGAGQIPELTVYGPQHSSHMTELLFGENGVLHPDINGRIHAPGSQRVYQNRGGKLPRKRPQPTVVNLYDGQIIETKHWKITVHEVLHQPGYIEAFGFRLETDEGVLTYSGDTGPCDAINVLARNADILIHMCYFVSGTFKPAGQLTASGHMEIAHLAAQTGVKTLVATHLTPEFDLPGVQEKCLAEMADVYPGRIVWGEDMMTLELQHAKNDYLLRTTMTRPNILLIYADQMRYDCMSPAGNSTVKTPHLQRLANEGLTFDNAYTSYPLCCPFRASMMTGKHPQGHGMTQNHFPLRADQEFLGERMKSVGYQTFYVGKWHLEGGPKPGFVPLDRRFGFDKFVGFNRGHSYLDGIFFRDTDQPYRCKRYEPDYQTDHLIEFISEAQNDNPDQPFLGYVSYGPPHHPNDMPDHWRSMYDPADVPLPTGTLSPEEQVRIQTERVSTDCNDNMKAALRSRVNYGSKKQLEPETEQEQRVFIAEYYAMISNIDDNVGRILNHLDQLGIAENTMVIFFSDHGDMLGEHGYYCGYKPQGYRSTMQVPLLVRYPEGITGGQRREAFIDLGIDTPATLLDLAGADPFSQAHGQSYRSVLEGTDTHRDVIHYQTFRMDDGAWGEFTPVPERGIRSKDWLYVRQPNRRKFLFDQNTDPHELTNLVHSTDHTALMDKFDAQIEAHMASTGDKWELHADFPPPDFLTHEAADDYLKTVLLPNAIEVP